jgi:hypothetical protein
VAANLHRAARVTSVLALVLGFGALAGAQDVRNTLPDALKIESSLVRVPHPRLEGYVTNHSLYTLQNVRVHVEILDEAGKTIGEASGWVFGNVFPGGRTYFVIAIPRAGASYRTTVTSWDITSRGN